MERVQEADRLREDMADRLREQVEAQKRELHRQEQLWKDRAQQSSNEMERLRVQLQEARGQLEDEATARDKYRKQADDLEGMLHKGKEVERKELVQLQFRITELMQETKISADHHGKAAREMKTEL